MKTKLLTFMGLGLLSAGVAASDFNHQIDLFYADVEDVDVIGIMGSHYLNSLSTDNAAWNEAEFMNRGSNINWMYADSDFGNDVSAYGLGFEFYGDTTNNLYASLNIVEPDEVAGASALLNFLGSGADGDDAVVSGKIGYFFARNWLVAIGTSDADNSPVELVTKYVADLGNGQFFNIEASIDDEEEDLTVTGDYYFSPQTSVGLTLSGEEGFDYGIEFAHFFQPNFAIALSHESTDLADTNTLRATFRF